jgi:hypothetical protein
MIKVTISSINHTHQYFFSQGTTVLLMKEVMVNFEDDESEQPHNIDFKRQFKQLALYIPPF